MLGIIGGVGPSATARLYLSLTSRFSAQVPHDLPELLIHSVAMTREIEDAFVGGLVGPRSPELKAVRDMLADAVGRLARGGAELVVMPCNTLQGELAQICTTRQIEHIDMLGATVEAIVAAEARRVLILGTTTTCRADLYGQRLRRHGVVCVYPDAGEQLLVEAYIRGALDRRTHQYVSLAELVREQAGACDGVVLACTDLSSDVATAAEGQPVFDSLECLAAAAIRRITRHEQREWREHGS
jgi:aspartate racemase